MSLIKVLAFLLLISLTFQKCKYHPSRIHWVFALDKSGSMSWNNPTRWTTLKRLLNNKNRLMDQIDHTSDFVSAYTFNSNPSPNIIYHYNIPSFPNGWNLPLGGSPSGGTNFAKALQRASSIIFSRRFESTCFVFVSDGEASYPSAQVTALRNLLASIRRRGCRTCVECYFIQYKYGAKIPKNYRRLCNGLSAKITYAPPDQFESVITKRFATAVAQIKSPTLND